MKISQFNLEKQLDRVHDWIKSADQKISISFAIINGVSLAFIIPTSKIIIDHTTYLTSYAFTISLIEALVFLAIAEVCSLLALFPRLKSKLSSKSILYFGSICNMSSKEFKERIRSETSNDLHDDYINQLVISSQICSIKHHQLKNAIQAFVVSLIFMFILLATVIKLNF